MTGPSVTSEQGVEALLDERALIDLTVRYTWALDHRRFEDLASVFAADGVADYGALGTFRGPSDIAQACAGALGPYDRTQHIVSNHQIDLHGDTATGRCYFQAQHVSKDTTGDHNRIVAGSYLDQFRRTDSGWRIGHRALRVTWTDGEVPSQDRLGSDGSNEMATSFVIAGWIEVDPEELDALMVAAVEMMHATHDEPGNLDYVFSADPATEGRIRIFERWRSDADLRGHFDTPHMAVFQKSLARAGVRDRDLARYHVSAVGPVF